MTLFDTFAAALDPDVDPEAFVAQDVERLLAETTTAAQLRWPGVELDDATFATAVAQRCSRGGLEELQRLALEDLYLAVACLERTPHALELFQRTLVEPVVEQVFAGETDIDEQIQRIVVGLVVGGPRSGPKLEQFGARGALKAWLRVSILRAAKNERRALARARKREPLSMDLLLGGALGEDPELDQIRRAHRDAFEVSLATAIDRMAALERRLLRQHHLQGLGLDPLAKVYGIHPVTVSRRLSRARKHLVELVRDELAARLSVSPSELDRTIATILSRVELSFDRLMASREEL